MKLELTSSLNNVRRFFFGIGEKGVERFFSLFGVIYFVVASIFYLFCNYMLLSSLLASFIIVGPVACILATILSACGLFMEK